MPATFPKKFSLGLSTLVIGSLCSSALLAQTSVIEEVVVTAQKRSQSLQDVSIAVSAFSGDAIEKMGFQEGLDITSQVPNMNFFAIFGEASSPSVSLRGMSLVNFSDSWESPVSIYVDDVYRGNPAGSAIQLFDLERVEVLRGPQGTLYGRNTTGGLMHYISRKPTHEFESSASVRVGSYDERIIEGVVSGPFSDSVRARLAVRSNKNDGWQTNVTNGKKLNNTDSFGYRGQLEFDLASSGNLVLNLHGSEADQNTVGFAHMGYLDPNGARNGDGDLIDKCPISLIHEGLCTSNALNTTGVAEVNGQFDPEHVASGASGGLVTKIDTAGASARLTWDFDAFQLTSISAYEELDKLMQDDGDGTAIVWFDEQYSVDAEQYTQELRLNGASSWMEWVAGAYYYKDDRGLRTEAPTEADAIVFGGWFHQEIVSLDTTSWAVFGQTDLDVTDQVTLVLGARYTDEQRDFVEHAGPTFYTYGPYDVKDDLAEDAFTWRAGIEWRPNTDTLLYGNVSTGFKSGGYSASYNFSPLATKPVDPEEIINYELGYKGTMADGRIRLNAAAFTYELKDFQSQIFLTVADGSVVTNVGDVTGTGAELEVTAQVTESLELIAGLGLLDTEFDSDEVYRVALEDYPADGNELPSAPGLTYNLVGRYYVELGSMGSLVLQADYAWQDDHYLQVENDPYSHHDSYGIANAKVSWLSPDEMFTVDAFVENATDEEYFTYQNTLGDGWGYAVWGKPRWAGVNASVKF